MHYSSHFFKKIAFFVLLSLFVYSSSALAQEKNTTGENDKTDTKKEVVHTTQTTEKKLSLAKQNRIKALFTAIEDTYRKTIDRLNALITKIETIASKVEKAGVEVSAIKDNITSTKDLLKEAGDSLDSIKTNISSALESETPKKATEEVKNSVKESAQKIKKAHESLVDTVKNFKDIQKTIESKAKIESKSSSEHSLIQSDAPKPAEDTKPDTQLPTKPQSNN